MAFVSSMLLEKGYGISAASEAEKKENVQKQAESSQADDTAMTKDEPDGATAVEKDGKVATDASDAVPDPLPTENAVDYDESPTTLYRSVESKAWDSVIKCIDEHPEEAATWIYRNEPDGRLRWRILPIHAAIIFRAPERVVEKLLSAHPQGAKSRDDQNMIPLHLAFRNGSSDAVIYELLSACPDSIEVKDRKGRIPLKLYTTSATNTEVGATSQKDAAKREKMSGFEKYVAVALEKDRQVSRMELEAEFASRLNNKEDEHKAELSKAQSEFATAEAKIKELETMVEATRSASVALMDKHQKKCDDEEKLKETLAAAEKSLQETSEVGENKASRLHEQNVKLDRINTELEEKVKELEDMNESQKKQIFYLKDELNASESKNKKMERKIDETRKASEALIVQYRNKCASKDHAEKCLREAEHQLKELSEKKEAEISELQEQNVCLKDAVYELRENIDQLDAANSQYKSQIGHVMASKEEIQNECHMLRSSANETMEMNASLKTQLKSVKGQVNSLSRQLVSIASEQGKIVEAATKQEKDMGSAMEERLKMLEFFREDMKETKAKAEMERDVITLTAQKRKEFLQKWLKDT